MPIGSSVTSGTIANRFALLFTRAISVSSLAARWRRNDELGVTAATVYETAQSAFDGATLRAYESANANANASG